MRQSELPPYERRQNDTYLMTIDRLARQLDSLQVLVPRLEVLQERLDSHVAQGERFQQEVRGLITEAFLDGDLDLHKEEHRTMRARTKLCRTFFEKLTDRAMSGTAWALLAVLVALIAYWWNGHMPKELLESSSFLPPADSRSIK